MSSLGEATTHHFFVLRHCVRSTHKHMSSGIAGNGGHHQSHDAQYYMKEPFPEWPVPEGECMPSAKHMIERTGQWLLESGMILGDNNEENIHHTIRWEIVADDSHRDMDTGLYLSQGLLSGLDSLFGYPYEDMNAAGVWLDSKGEDGVHVDARFSGSQDFCHESISSHEYHDEMKHRLKTVPRPTLSLRDGLQLLQDVVGVGKQGKLVGTIDPIEPELDGSSLLGAAILLKDVSQLIFMARLSESDLDTTPFDRLTATQMYQLLEFRAWYRTVRETGHSYAAFKGAVGVQALLHTLQHGFYRRRLVKSSSGDNSNRETSATSDLQETETYEDGDGYDDDEADDDDKEVSQDSSKAASATSYTGTTSSSSPKKTKITTVTIILAHDTDLDYMATALGVKWSMQAPYRSGPDPLLNNAYTVTPPLSGFHAVRHADTDEIGLSFVYPVYTEVNTENDEIVLNRTGILESSPLLFDREVPYSRMDSTTTYIQAPPQDVHEPRSEDDDTSSPSVNVLRDHIMSVLSGYHKQAIECFHNAEDYWAVHADLVQIPSIFSSPSATNPNTDFPDTFYDSDYKDETIYTVSFMQQDPPALSSSSSGMYFSSSMALFLGLILGCLAAPLWGKYRHHWRIRLSSSSSSSIQSPGSPPVGIEVVKLMDANRFLQNSVKTSAIYRSWDDEDDDDNNDADNADENVDI